MIQLEQNKDLHDFLERVSGKMSALCEVHGARDSDIAERFIPGSQRSCVYALVPARPQLTCDRSITGYRD